MRVLVVNAGSSSLKLSVLEDGRPVDGLELDRWEGSGHVEEIAGFVDGAAGGVDAVGHRVVHGGPRYESAVVVDDRLLAYLRSIEDLAPLHNPRAVAGIEELARLLPGVPAVACFDTAFHATMPEAARTYALPREWNSTWGLRRYGFHGLSHAYAARRAAQIVGRPLETLRIVSCHLGAGASLCAVVGGRSVDTTMGFTPLEGLVMVTRSGSVDPGLLLWLLRQGHVDVERLNATLEHESGLRGLSATSGDLREVLAARDAGSPAAGTAFDVFVHRLRREIGAMTAAAGGLDVLVFTGGIGEHSAEARAAAGEGLGHLGVRLDPELNASVTTDAEIGATDAAVRTLVVTAREDLEIERLTREVLGGAATESRRTP